LVLKFLPLLCLALAALAACERRDELPFQPASTALTGVLVRQLTAAQLRDAGLPHGLVVVRVGPPADRSAIRSGDVVVAVDKRPVRSIAEFDALLARAGAAVSLSVKRGRLDLLVALDRAPPASPGGARPGDRRHLTSTLLRT
jgi:S1-C subfamily serine protease